MKCNTRISGYNKDKVLNYFQWSTLVFKRDFLRKCYFHYKCTSNFDIGYWYKVKLCQRVDELFNSVFSLFDIKFFFIYTHSEIYLPQFLSLYCCSARGFMRYTSGNIHWRGSTKQIVKVIYPLKSNFRPYNGKDFRNCKDTRMREKQLASWIQGTDIFNVVVIPVNCIFM